MLIIDTQKGNNNKHSGGLPHSEIHGSKLILSSPWLIAEYHVFHRLTAKASTKRPFRAWFDPEKIRLNWQPTLVHIGLLSRPKVIKIYFPIIPKGMIKLVYLTWTTLFFSASKLKGGRGKDLFQKLSTDKSVSQYWGFILTYMIQTVLIFYLSLRCKNALKAIVRLDG